MSGRGSCQAHRGIMLDGWPPIMSHTVRLIWHRWPFRLAIYTTIAQIVNSVVITTKYSGWLMDFLSSHGPMCRQMDNGQKDCPLWKMVLFHIGKLCPISIHAPTRGASTPHYRTHLQASSRVKHLRTVRSQTDTHGWFHVWGRLYRIGPTRQLLCLCHCVF